MRMHNVFVTRIGVVTYVPVDHLTGHGISWLDRLAPFSSASACIYSIVTGISASSLQTENASEQQGKSCEERKIKRKVRRKGAVDFQVQDKIDPR